MQLYQLLVLICTSLAYAQYAFADRAQLLVARDAWCSDSTSAAQTYGQIGTWDVSRVTDFFNVFCGFSCFGGMTWCEGCNSACYTFNDDISSWDTSAATTFEGFFNTAGAFNNPLPWNTSRVTNMRATFDRAHAFDQRLNWDVSKVTTFYRIFWSAGGLSDCNKAHIHAAFASNPEWSNACSGCGPHTTWSSISNACPPEPPLLPLPPAPPPPPPTTFFIQGSTSRLAMGPQGECVLEVGSSSSTISSSCPIIQPPGRRMMQNELSTDSLDVNEKIYAIESRLAKLESENEQLKHELKVLRDA
jgi:hypothetical protein